MQISSCHLTLNSENCFININNKNVDLLTKQYSLAKYGSIKDIKVFANIIIESLFQEIDNPQSEFRSMLEIAKQDNDYIVLMTPGYRNVKSSANIMFDMALPHINTKLAIMGFPIVAKLKLPRLANPCENYASLTTEERKIIGLTTDHILPDKDFYKNNNIHVIYGDDILITGSSSNKAKNDALSKGAKSFTSIFSIIIDKEVALNNPSIEEQINKYKVTEKLDSTAKEIFIQDDFIPVLRSLRLLLNVDNLSDLKQFLNKIPNHNLLKIYISYITNESLYNTKYLKSFELIKEYLILHNKIKPCGNLKIGEENEL
jgi:hypothetical protein